MRPECQEVVVPISELDVYGVIKIDRSAVPAEKHGGLSHRVCSQEYMNGLIALTDIYSPINGAGRTASGINHLTRAVGEVRIGVGVEQRDQPFDGIRLEKVVRCMRQEVVGVDMPEALTIAGVAALVLVAGVGQDREFAIQAARSRVLKDLQGPIGRSVIDRDHLEGLAGLRGEGVERLLHERRMLVADQADRDASMILRL